MQDAVSLTSPPVERRAVSPDAKRTLVVLPSAMAATLILTAGATALLIALAGKDAWWSGWVASVIVSVLATTLSLALVVPGVIAGFPWTAYAYLAGSLVRMITALGGCVTAVLVFHTPPAPTLILIVPIYFGQMAVEVVVLGRAFWPRG